jgi:hypothetical protein
MFKCKTITVSPNTSAKTATGSKARFCKVSEKEEQQFFLGNRAYKL